MRPVYRLDTMTLRRLLSPLLGLFAATLALPAWAQEPVLEEEVEIREVGVVGDLDRGLRGLSSAELAARIVVLEDGVTRTPTSVGALAAPGRATYSRVVVAFDAVHCEEEISSAGAAAVGSEAERLVALGPVDVVRAGERSETVLQGATSAEAVAKVAADFARAQTCPADSGSAPIVPPGLEAGKCDAKPCLLVWVGAGWGLDAAAVEAASAELEKRLEALASGGWVVLAAPIAPDPQQPKTGPTIRPPENKPGTDRYTFGLTIGGRKKEKLTEEEYGAAVELWLTPLRRLSAATAGELAGSSAELAIALDALAERSILWYRAERTPGATAPRLEVREAGGTARRLRTPEWAPSLVK